MNRDIYVLGKILERMIGRTVGGPPACDTSLASVTGRSCSILLLATSTTSREFAAAISLSSSSTIYKRLLSMHSKSHALSDYCRGVDNDYCRDTAAQRKS